MTITTQKPLTQSVNPPEKLAPRPIEAERMRDVQLLLQNLINNEEATVKLILDCLYDVGSVNLINQKLRLGVLNRMMKLITQMSKPIFRVFAWYWFKKNCPQLITDWLLSKVTFENPVNTPPISVEASEVQAYYPLEAEILSREVRYLRQQVRLLIGISIASLLALGVTVTMLNRSPEVPLQSRQQSQ
ncbi:hypothetical protein Cylst_1255 [Cylindrospermum stagnale PCC 7417]|uniref:Uncharacterized protein n=1 Tax=Cylindrospermum stagnale PCC 7417 TaxID=56107 RepID=K9WT47_9NOST|nr:hypothetical protein [Cylindrospermum stagnale]AFZ23550.1 hypothetical protein Cylst_1255 [Cylindrospermum stagnale PCC 7417]